jgi:hypothetical protein
VMAEVSSGPHPRPAWHRRLALLPAAIGHQLFPWSAHSSGQGDRSSETFRRAGMAGGGVIVAKKLLWGVAGLAVVVILAVVYFNGRTVDQGAQGAIGAADRYRGAQPSSVNAKPGDAQKFLQSDTFNRMMKSKDVRALLDNPEFCAILANPQVALAFKDPQVQLAVESPEMQLILDDPAVVSVLGHQDVVNLFGDTDVQMALGDPKTIAAINSGSFEMALRDGGSRNLLFGDELQAALGNKDNAMAVFQQADAALARNVKGQVNLRIVQNGVQRSIAANSTILALLDDPTFQASIVGGQMANFLGNANVEMALKNDGAFLNVFTSDTFEAALTNMSKLFGDPEFQSAVHGMAALQGAQAAMNKSEGQAAVNKAEADAALSRSGLGSKPNAAMFNSGDVAALFRLAGDPGIMAMIRDGNLVNVFGDPDFMAALNNQVALQAGIHQAGLQQQR